MENQFCTSPKLKSVSDSEDFAVKRSPLAPLQWKSLNARSLYKNKVYNVCNSSPREGKNIRLKRAQQLGLTYSPKDSYLHNQSFPCSSNYPENDNVALDMGELHKCSLEKFKGDSLSSFSFSPNSKRSPYPCSSNCYQNRNLSGSWLFYRYIDGGSFDAGYHVSVQNPNKAIVTIDARTTEILIANKLACRLLGIKENSPVKKRLCDFILSREDQCSLAEVDLEPSGELVLFSGKVMDLVTSKNNTTPVSVWARQLFADEDLRCLVVMEPVERTTAVVDFDGNGNVISCDSHFALLYGYEKAEDLKDISIRDLIPSIDFDTENNEGKLVPEEGAKQCATGRMKDGSTFPLCINIIPCKSEDGTMCKEPKALNSFKKQSSQTTLLRGTVWVFNNISGMITLLQDGTIHSCNTNFSLMLFGYTQNELEGLNITSLIPTFYDDLEYLDTDSMALPPFDDDDDSNARYCSSDGRTTADSFATEPSRPINPMSKHVGTAIDDAVERMEALTFSPSIEIRIPSSSHEELHTNLRTHPECDELNTHQDSKSVCKKLVSDLNEPPETEELSESSHYEHSSHHFSFSESQGTLHSCTNSITESDVNANVLESPEPAEYANSLRSPMAKSLNIVSEGGSPQRSTNSCCDEENASDDFESDSSSSSDDENYELPPSASKSPLAEVRADGFEEQNSKSTNCVEEGHSRGHKLLVSSTPRGPATEHHPFGLIGSHISEESAYSIIIEGCYNGIGRHKDGSDLAIEYYIKKAYLDDGSFLYCMWVSRDPVDSSLSRKGFSAVANSYSSCSLTTSQSSSQISQYNESCSSIESDATYSAGIFSEKFSILQHIGKGAFGCVKKAYRVSDGLLVIAKFIRKSTVYKELWVYDNHLNKRVPLEVSILTTVVHPNIVKVLEIFENEKYYQMIMEKHGSGMDLFEFIERNPNMDEPLASFIFRQVVSALKYLDSLLIVHRDIKDENIILDHNFHVRLIDFGSAAFRGEELFSTFCGTMEYCSPEVIRGNKYRGPELEMWALGVTLYTLIFGENPFVDVQETLKAELRFPFTVSSTLSNLLKHLLEPEPLKRCTLAEAESHFWTNQPVQIEKYKFCEVVNASAEEIDPPKYITDQFSFNDAHEFKDKVDSDIE